LLNDEAILELSDDVIRGKIIPLIESFNQEFFVYMEEELLVAGQSTYPIPYRAIGRSLRELKIRDPNNNIRNMPLVALEDAQYYINNSFVAGFYFESDNIRLVPNVPANIVQSNYLQKWYRMPPSQLITLSNAGKVTAINGDDVTVMTVPSTFIVGEPMDFIQGRSGNSIYSIDKAIVAINGNIITFATGDVPTKLTIGDYIAPAQFSPVINFIPDEVYPYIETRVGMRVLSAIGDFEGLKNLEKEVKEDKDYLGQLLQPRIEGEPTLIVNRRGLVRGNKVGQRTWLYGGQ
jgi:hypothetical protein